MILWRPRGMLSSVLIHFHLWLTEWMRRNAFLASWGERGGYRNAYPLPLPYSLGYYWLPRPPLLPLFFWVMMIVIESWPSDPAVHSPRIAGNPTVSMIGWLDCPSSLVRPSQSSPTFYSPLQTNADEWARRTGRRPRLYAVAWRTRRPEMSARALHGRWFATPKDRAETVNTSTRRFIERLKKISLSTPRNCAGRSQRDMINGWSFSLYPFWLEFKLFVDILMTGVVIYWCCRVKTFVSTSVVRVDKIPFINCQCGGLASSEWKLGSNIYGHQVVKLAGSG